MLLFEPRINRLPVFDYPYNPISPNKSNTGKAFSLYDNEGFVNNRSGCQAVFFHYVAYPALKIVKWP
jgi:hypothetical protein